MRVEDKLRSTRVRVLRLEKANELSDERWVQAGIKLVCQ